MALPNAPHQTGRVNSGDGIQIVTADARHDVPGQAPDAIIAHVRKQKLRKLTGTM